MPELWDLYDSWRRPLGRTHPRGKALTYFFYAAYPLHLCALALIRVMRIIPPYFWG